MPVGEPIGKVQYKTGEEACLGKTEQKPYGHETVRANCEGGTTRDDTPGDHDPRDPQPGADLFENEIAGHLEQDIAPEERTRSHAVPGGIEADVLVHRQCGEAHVDAVEITEEISQHRKRQDAQIDLAHCGLFDRSKHILHRNYLGSCTAL